MMAVNFIIKSLSWHIRTKMTTEIMKKEGWQGRREMPLQGGYITQRSAYLSSGQGQ
jgi:hypothetical protein